MLSSALLSSLASFGPQCYHKTSKQLRLAGVSGDQLTILMQRHPEQGCPETHPSDFELSARRFHSLPGQPVPLVLHLHSTEYFLRFRRTLLCSGLPTVSCPGTGHHRKVPGFTLLHCPLRYLYMFMKSSLSFLFSSQNSPISLRLIS